MKSAALLLVLAACGPTPKEQCEETFAKLDAIRLEAQADIIRQRAECQAVAVEFKGDQMLVSNCMDTLNAMIEMHHATNANIDKRLAEPDMVQCSANR